MARANKFQKVIKRKKEKDIEYYKNIKTLETASGQTHYYASYMVGGKYYQNVNLTKEYGIKHPSTAEKKVEELKVDARRKKNPDKHGVKKKVKEVVINNINNKKPKNKDSEYKTKLTTFYYKYVDDVIGHLYLDKVTDDHVETIMEQIEGYRKEYQKNLQILMFKIFEKEFRKKRIDHNPFYDLDYGEHREKPNFDIRLNETIEEVAKKLYLTALEYQPRYKLFLLMTIMLARRVGELHKLRFGNIKKFSDGDWYVLAKEDITKTNVNEKYPLPQEVVNLLPRNVLDEKYENEKLFNFSESSISYNWNKLVKQAKIKINKGYTLTSHDSRKLFLSILSHSGVDSDIADRCISHKKRGIKGVYLDVPYTIKKEIFVTWWEFLRTDKNILIKGEGQDNA